ncbi:putative teichoic acid/polysaccharide biosynthesis protein [Lactiplantibacillus paraplantarum]|uniref:capsular polysaccharide synthesis protein n=1 Tax=Lactiplantibacillus paraplantarum TaxID=60520 RepID=UPI0003ADCA5C|nr:capsular polysaccharide synthesis protein [Lactiplantibacillus paraplantarum]ERL44700.1 putative teichoic acid/polysaccharide biosynthesis protein [Lactiplantibacillus paraplantarum]
MGALSSAIKKFGARQLIADYWNSHTVLYMFRAVLLNGFNKTALEIVRNGQEAKVMKRLFNQNKALVEKPLNAPIRVDESGNDNKTIWFLWYQGISNAPEIVKACYKSVLSNFPDHKVIVLDTHNLNAYIRLPDWIETKRKNGEITLTHYSDLVRTELLVKYGGIWIDSTVLLTDRIPDYWIKAERFYFQELRPGNEGHAIKLSSWFLSTNEGDPVLFRVRELLWKYWETHDVLIDYYLFHHFFQLVLDAHPEEIRKTPQYPSSIPHMLLFKLQLPYSKKEFEYITSLTPLHKLTYKTESTQEESTYYRYLLNKYL